MSLVHTPAVRNVLANAAVDAIDNGTIAPNGKLIFMTSGDVEVATLDFANPAFGDAVAGSASSNAIVTDSAATGGVIALFKAVDRDGVEVYRGNVTVTGGSGDIQLSSLTIAPNDSVAVSSLTYTASV